MRNAISTTIKPAVELVLLVVFVGLLVVPTLTVINLTPQQRITPEGSASSSPEILGVKTDQGAQDKISQPLTPIETTPLISIVPFSPSSQIFSDPTIQQTDPKSYLIYSEIRARTAGDYKTRLLTLRNTSSRELTASISPYQLGESTHTKVSVMLGDQKFDLFNDSNQPQSPTATLKPGDSLEISIELQSLRDVNFSETQILRLAIE